MTRKLWIICLFILFRMLTSHSQVYAENMAEMDENGNVNYITVDVAAISKNKTWRNLGFTVKNKKTFGNPSGNPKGLFMLKDAEHEVESDGNGNNITYYTFSHNKVQEVFKAAEVNEDTLGKDPNNRFVYLNSIFGIYHNGEFSGKECDTYKEITSEGWRDNSGFWQHFDIVLKYKSVKQPVYVEYRTTDNVVIGERKKMPQEVFVDAQASVTFYDKKADQGINYTLIKSFFHNLGTGKDIKGSTKTLGGNTTIDEVKKRDADMVPGGILFVAVMKPVKEISTEPISGVIEKELEEPDIEGVIGADDRGAERFHVEDGIPTTESLYVNGYATEYLTSYKFVKETGTKEYEIPVSKTYYKSWSTVISNEKGDTIMIPQSRTVTVHDKVTIRRTYAYWRIDNLDIYAVDSMEFVNEALPGGRQNIVPAEYRWPTVIYDRNTELNSHIFEADHPDYVTLPAGTVAGGSFEPATPTENFAPYIETMVGKVLVKNDQLIFNGSVIMDPRKTAQEGPEPQEIETCSTLLSPHVLFQNNLVISSANINKDCSSYGTVYYKCIVSPKSKDIILTYKTWNINPVVVHTPVVCDAQIEDKKAMNQMISPDLTRNPLILDTKFKIKLPTDGMHLAIKGYGYRDYAKYTAKRQAKFPFDVYQGLKFISKGKWFDIDTETEFYLPVWVDEGLYTMDFRSVSINAEANGKMECDEPVANVSMENYIASDTIDVEVSGRLYGLNLYDISDYPVWQPVFRQKNSLKRTEFHYPVGVNNRNGILTGWNPKYTLSLINGSHPAYEDAGIIKTGYVTRFYLSTIGTMYGEEDYIRIIPRFYYVNKNGTNRREVDVYYSETFLGKKNVMVKVGSEKDELNIKSLRTGDEYLSIPIQELEDTSRINYVSLKEWKLQKCYLFTYQNIMIPKQLRTYAGKNYTPNGLIPPNVDPDKISKSMQNWYGEYYIPSEIHVTEKGFDVLTYAKENGGLDYYESFWLKNGYLVVNFDIESIHNKERSLSYINPINEPNGYCNMWKKEGYRKNKVDSKGNEFSFSDGDYVLYDTEKSAARDYISRGTH